jgi:hypothetical protein
MANRTIFQTLSKVIGGGSGTMTPKPIPPKTVHTYNINNDILYTTKNKADFEEKKLQAQQEKLLAMQWYKAGVDLAASSTESLTNLQMMYRDADLMEVSTPEIGTALEIVAEETCMIGNTGKMLNVSSKSNRIKAILEDLFYNRLDLHVMLPMVVKDTAKYGNEFMMLNINAEDGITGWRRLPVYEMQRLENGITNPYMAVGSITQVGEIHPDETKFLWVGRNVNIPYQNWQVAHFRLINDSTFLPYGCSWLHKARRSWRMLTMMEDMMLIYRLERSIERRVFKIYTGAIDDKDVPAYMQQVANQFKRTPIIDPQTGQIDLRKNFASVDSDFFIPFRSEETASKIEPLGSVQNPTAMDDIEYVKQHLLAALRVPKAFLNFTDPSQNKGQNLSIMDVRFSRMINRVQQAVLMELNKIAMIHLLILGFTDEVTNFTLTMNNPSSQIEMQELDALSKRVSAAQTLLQDPGNGIQIYSYHRVLKEILHMSDTEIADNLNEIRLEKALAAELQLTQQVIKKTGIFDPTDRIYGDPQAKYDYSQMEEGEGGPGGGGAPGGGMDMGGGIDDLGGPEGGDVGGAEESMDMGGAPAADAGEPVAESRKKKENIITEILTYGKPKYSFFDEYMKKINEGVQKEENSLGRVETVSDSFIINEELNSIVGELDTIISEGNLEDVVKQDTDKTDIESILKD